jgi:enamine deaminase RidA (YjgF/YER057c/UK114 family)
VPQIHEIGIAEPQNGYPSAMSAGDLFMTSGQHGIAKDGSIPDDVKAQAELCFSRIAGLLAAQRLDFSHVLRISGYVTRAEDIAPFEAVRDRVLGPLGAKPATTLLVVSALARAEYRVEVEATALRPTRDASVLSDVVRTPRPVPSSLES